MTVYNSGAYLQRAIESVIGQTYTDWELIILDDGSTDPLVAETIEALRIWNRPQITYVNLDPTEEDRRASVRYATNINYGASITSGELISYLAGDDYYMPNRLERMIAKIREGHSVVYGPQLLLGEGGQHLGVRPTWGRINDGWHLIDFNSVLHTREAFELAGGWPTENGYWTDADGHFWKRLGRVGFLFIPVDGPEPTDAKVYRSTSVTHNVLSGRDPWHEEERPPVVEKPHWVVSG
jgi:glycosyltransferase involved in cell wall biosynthesis